MKYRLYKFNLQGSCYIRYIIVDFSDCLDIKPKHIVHGELGEPRQCTINNVIRPLSNGYKPFWLDLIYENNNYKKVLTHLFIISL